MNQNPALPAPSGLPAATVDIMGQRVSLNPVAGYDTVLWEDLLVRWDRCVVSGAADQTLSVGFTEDPDERGRLAGEGTLLSTTVEQLEETLSSTLTLRGIEFNKGRKLMIHACGFANEHGQVIALAGPSGTGKTTLTRTVGPRYGYITDETVCVGFDGSVTPYPKPLSVIWKKGQPKVQVSPDELGLGRPAGRLELAGIVLLNRSADGPLEPRVEEVGLFDAITELLPELSYLALVDRPLQRLSGMIEAVGGVRRFVYSEAAKLDGPLQRLFGQSSVPGTTDWSASLLDHQEPSGREQPGPAARKPLDEEAATDLAPDTRIGGVELDDRLDQGGEALIFHEGQVIRIGGIAPLILDVVAERSPTRSELAARLVEMIGEAPEGQAEALVSAAVAELLRHGLVVAAPAEEAGSPGA